MADKIIEHMVRLVQRGVNPRKVWETSMTYHPGATVMINKATTAKKLNSQESIDVAKDTLVTIVGVGGGPSGHDMHCRLPDGTQAIVPFYDLGGISPN